jgi:hypothetical protein
LEAPFFGRRLNVYVGDFVKSFDAKVRMYDLRLAAARKLCKRGEFPGEKGYGPKCPSRKKKGGFLNHLSHKEIKMQARESLFRPQCNDEVWWTQQPMHALAVSLQPFRPEAPEHTGHIRLGRLGASSAWECEPTASGPRRCWPTCSSLLTSRKRTQKARVRR